jgi:hypothetical protein
MSEAVRSKNAEQLTPHEAVLRSFGYIQRVTPDELKETRRCLEVALQQAPAYGDGVEPLQHGAPANLPIADRSVPVMIFDASLK